MTWSKRLIFLAVCFTLALLLWQSRGAAQIAGPPVNFGFTVDRGQGISRGNAIAVDSKNVYFAYYYLGDLISGRPGEVMYEAFPLVFGCANVPCAFVPPIPTTVDVIGPIPTAPGPNGSLFAYTIGIGLDPQHVPHIVYQDGQGGLKHAEFCPCADNLNIGWQRETIPIPGGIYSAMAVDKSGAVHVVSSTGGAISYSKKINGVWSSPEAIIGPASLAGLSLAVDSSGNPHVLWADHRSTFNELVLAHRGTGPFFWNSGNFEIVSSDWAEWISLALDANDSPSVSYWGGPCSSTTSELIYVPRQGGFWPPQAVDSFDFPSCFTNPPPYIYHNTSLAFSPGGFPRVSYGYDHHFAGGVEAGGIALASQDGFFWHKQALDNDPIGALNSTSLAVDAADISHVLFVITNCQPGTFCSDFLYYERISNANTPVGGPVTVNLGDPAGLPNPITVTFTQVSQNGLTSVSMADPSAGPALPANFQLGNPPVYYDVSTATMYTPPVTVCFPYGNVSNPAGMAVFHNEQGVMVNRTVSNNTVTHTICAQVNSLSLFAVLQGQTLPVCAPDVSNSVSVTRSGYSYSAIFKRYAQVVTLTNTSASPISGPIYLALDNLSGTASLYNAAGKTGCAAPTGSPYVTVAGPLAAGAHVTAVLQFTDPTNTAISYTPRVLAGAGQP
jgi:hypothetical protein